MNWSQSSSLNRNCACIICDNLTSKGSRLSNFHLKSAFQGIFPKLDPRNKLKWTTAACRDNRSCWDFDNVQLFLSTLKVPQRHVDGSRSLLMLLIKYRPKTGWHTSPCRQSEPVFLKRQTWNYTTMHCVRSYWELDLSCPLICAVWTCMFCGTLWQRWVMGQMPLPQIPHLSLSQVIRRSALCGQHANIFHWM